MYIYLLERSHVGRTERLFRSYDHPFRPAGGHPQDPRSRYLPILGKSYSNPCALRQLREVPDRHIASTRSDPNSATLDRSLLDLK